MKTFYSILSAVINPLSGEKISIGLILSNGNNSIFHFSDNRLSLLNGLVDKETRRFIKMYLKSIESVIEKVDINQPQLTIFEEQGKNVIINEPYIDYLSDYNQNVITFSKPVGIDVLVNQNIFSTLFSKFIDKESDIKSVPQRNIQIVKTEFLPKIKLFYSVEKEITPDEYKGLVLPVTIDFMGKNDQYVAGQFFDLEKNVNFIKNDYFDYQQVKENIPLGMSFLISSEPEKNKYPQQHYFWEFLRKQKNCKYLNINDLDEIETYAVQHGVRPVE